MPNTLAVQAAVIRLSGEKKQEVWRGIVREVREGLEKEGGGLDMI